MTDLSDLQDLSNLQARLDKMGLVITLKEPTEAMLKRGWHCIDFDRPGYSDGRTQWDRPPPHQTSMKQDVRDAFTLMNEEAQPEIGRRFRLFARRVRTVRFQGMRTRSVPPGPQP